MMRNRTFVALAVLVLVGGATLWKVTRPEPYSADTTPSAGAAVYQVHKADVDELEIAEPGKPAIDLKKDGAEWKVTVPLEDRADQKAVDQALDALESLKLKDVIAENPESYASVGVADGDVAKVVAKKAGKPLATLLIGKTTNLRLEGDPRVFSTVNLKRYALVKEPRMFRDRVVAEVANDSLDKVTLEYPAGAKIVVAREPQPQPPAPEVKDGDKAPPAPAKVPDKWVVKEGAGDVGGAVDEALAQNVASALSRLEADDFADAAPAATTGLDKPRTVVTAVAKDGATRTILIGKDEGQSTYAKLKDGARIWKLRKYDADRFPASAAQWRDKVIVRLDPASVTKVQIDKDKDKTVLERVDDKTFKATGPADLGELDGARVQSFVRALSMVKATRVVEGMDAKAAGLDKPRAVLTVWTKGGQSVKLTMAPSKNNEAVVSVSNLKDLYALSDFQAGNLAKGPKDFKKVAPQAGAPPPPPGSHM